MDRDWRVFRVQIRDDDQEIERGEIGWLWDGANARRVHMFAPMRDVDVRPVAVTSLNGEPSVHAILAVVKAYAGLGDGAYRERQCRHLLHRAQANASAYPDASREIEAAIYEFEHYSACSGGWGDYRKGELYFICHLGEAVLDILGL